RDLYRGLVKELEVKHAAADELPEGVEACLRETEERRYLFLQNFSGREAEVKLTGAWERVDTGEPVKQAVLTGYDALTLRSSSK
ncbi:MAG: Beta-galactosidase C-terminal domain, partial [Eubacteriales bacterium]